MFAALRPGGKLVIADYGLQPTWLMRGHRLFAVNDGESTGVGQLSPEMWDSQTCCLAVENEQHLEPSNRPFDNRTVAKDALGLPAFLRGNRWRSSTSTTPEVSKRDNIAHLGTLDFVTARDNVVFLGPPGTGKTHLAIRSAIHACQAGHPRPVRYCLQMGRPARRRPSPRHLAALGSEPTSCSNKPPDIQHVDVPAPS
jgi:IstB-like ATP binding protein